MIVGMVRMQKVMFHCGFQEKMLEHPPIKDTLYYRLLLWVKCDETYQLIEF